MRHQGCTFLVEDEIDSSSLPGCDREVQILEQKIRPAFKPLSRTVRRVTFFKTHSEAESPSNKKVEAYIKALATDRHKALERSQRDKAFLRANLNEFDPLGFVYVYSDSYKGAKLSSYVPQAVVRPLPWEESWFVHSRAEFSAYVADIEQPVPIRGSFFAQQEGATWCCAHAAIAVLLQTMHKGNVAIDYEEMNQLVGIDHESRLAGDGLAVEEIARIIKEYNIETDAYDTLVSTDHPRVARTGPDFVLATAYHSVESGFPAILCFRGDPFPHAMAVVGHTFDPCLWPINAKRAYFGAPASPYLSSREWVPDLIVMDDNFGPYSTLPKSMLREQLPAVVVPKPHQSKRQLLAGADVERFAAELLCDYEFENGRYFQSLLNSNARPDQSNYWFWTLLQRVIQKRYVLRTLAIKPSDYEIFLNKHHPEDCNQCVLGPECERLLEDLIRGRIGDFPTWLVEISVPELYQWNNRRLGEIILQEDLDEPGTLRLSVIRVPGVLSVPNSDEKTVKHYPVRGNYHYPIATLSNKASAGP